MALPVYALVTTSEAKEHLRIKDEYTGSDAKIEDNIAQASRMIEQYINRRVVFRGTVATANTYYTEFHDIFEARTRIRLLERPVIAIDALNEDVSRLFPVGDKLTEDTDFIMNKEWGQISRISDGSTPLNFEFGEAAIRLVYAAGYEDNVAKDNIPYDFKVACLRTVARLYREADRKSQNVQRKSDGLSNMTITFPDMIPDDVKEMLEKEINKAPYSTGRPG